MTKTYAIYLNHDGEMAVHKTGCAHIKRDKKRVISIDDIFEFEADNAWGAIDKMKQYLFESAGGIGNIEDADQDEDAYTFAQQEFNIINCAKR